MNEIVNKFLFLFPTDKFMPEMWIIVDCGSFTKNKERIKNLKKQDIQDILIKTI